METTSARSLVSLSCAVLAAAASLVATGCGPRTSAPRAPSSADDSDRITPPPRDAGPRIVFGRIVRIHFQGAKQVPEEELRALVWIDKDASPTGDPSSDVPRDILQRDVLLVNSGYYDRGFMLVEISPPIVTEAKDAPYVDVVVPIKKEGPRIRIRKVTVRDGSLDLRARISLPDGAWFARDALVRDISALRTYYRDQGYANVEVDPETEIDPIAATVDVNIPVRRGPLVRIERIEVAGNKKTPAATILSRITLAVGDLSSETKLVDSKKRVMALGAFARVDVVTMHGSDDAHMIATFEVTEK